MGIPSHFHLRKPLRFQLIICQVLPRSRKCQSVPNKAQTWEHGRQLWRNFALEFAAQTFYALWTLKERAPNGHQTKAVRMAEARQGR